MDTYTQRSRGSVKEDSGDWGKQERRVLWKRVGVEMVMRKQGLQRWGKPGEHSPIGQNSKSQIFSPIPCELLMNPLASHVSFARNTRDPSTSPHLHRQPLAQALSPLTWTLQKPPKWSPCFFSHTFPNSLSEQHPESSFKNISRIMSPSYGPLPCFAVYNAHFYAQIFEGKTRMLIIHGNY